MSVKLEIRDLTQVGIHDELLALIVGISLTYDKTNKFFSTNFPSGISDEYSVARNKKAMPYNVRHPNLREKKKY